MNEDKSSTPESESTLLQSKKIETTKSKRKKIGFMSESAIMRFVNEVNEGENLFFDVTTLDGFAKELLFRIKKIDVTGLGSQLAFFFLFVSCFRF